MPFHSEKSTTDHLNESRPSLGPADKPQRDLRIDFFRGAALWIIFIDHLEWGIGTSLVSDYTLKGIGFSDAAEVFVFISGYVFGIVYDRLRQKSGYIACQLKALRRSVQIYVAHLLTLWTVLLFVAIVSSQGTHWFGRFSLQADSHELIKAAGLALGLLYQPYVFGVLPVYMVMLLMMPILLVLLRWNVWVACLPPVRCTRRRSSSRGSTCQPICGGQRGSLTHWHGSSCFSWGWPCACMSNRACFAFREAVC